MVWFESQFSCTSNSVALSKVLLRLIFRPFYVDNLFDEVDSSGPTMCVHIYYTYVYNTSRRVHCCDYHLAAAASTAVDTTTVLLWHAKLQTNFSVVGFLSYSLCVFPATYIKRHFLDSTNLCVRRQTQMNKPNKHQETVNVSFLQPLYEAYMNRATEEATAHTKHLPM